MVAQVLDAPKKSSKILITNEVCPVFEDSLCTSITCTLKLVSISGLGVYIKDYNDTLLKPIKKYSVIVIKTNIEIKTS